MSTLPLFKEQEPKTQDLPEITECVDQSGFKLHLVLSRNNKDDVEDDVLREYFFGGPDITVIGHQTPISETSQEAKKPDDLEGKIFLSRVPDLSELKEPFSFYSGMRLMTYSLIFEDYLRGNVISGTRDKEEEKIAAFFSDNASYCTVYLTYEAEKNAFGYEVKTPLATAALFKAYSIRELPSWKKSLWRKKDKRLVDLFLNEREYGGIVGEFTKLAAGVGYCGCISRVFAKIVDNGINQGIQYIFISTSEKHAKNYENAGVSEVFWETLHRSKKVGNKTVVVSVLDLSKIKNSRGYKYMQRISNKETLPWDFDSN